MIARVIKRVRLKIRRLRADDAEIWRALRLEALNAHPEAYSATHDEAAGRSLAAFAARLEAGMVYGAFLHDDLIGSMALDLSDADPQTGEITSVYMRHEYRRLGGSKRLFSALLRAARRQKLTILTLDVAEENTGAIAFYQAMKFKIGAPAGRALIRDGRMIELVTMLRQL